MGIQRKYASAFFLLAALAIVLGHSWMFSEITVPNERSRIYLTISLLDEGELAIDSAVVRFGPVNDWARHDGHYYTDKAPGSSFLALIPYAIVRCFSEPGDWSIQELVNLERTYLMIPLSLLGLLILLRILILLDVRRNARIVTVGAWLLGTTALHYSTAFYGHQIVAVCLLAAVHGLLLFDRRTTRRGLSMAYTGCSLGLAGLTEYQALPLAAAVAVYAVYAVFKHQQRKHLAWFVLGAAPFAVAFLLYHASAFGGPLDVSYNHIVSQAIQANHQRGIGGVGLPQWDAVIGSLFSLHRGLFTTSPIFLWVPFGLVLLHRRMRSLAVVVVVLLSLALLIIFGADVWYAGWSFGPRLLVPVMGVAMIPIAFAIDRVLDSPPWLRGLVLGAVIVGVAYNELSQAVFPELPENALNPVVDIMIPMFRADIVTPNIISHYFGPTGGATLIPLAIALVGALVTATVIFAKGVQTLRGRVMLGLGTLIVPLIVVTFMEARGQTWSDRDREDWIGLVQQWQEREGHLR